MITQYEIEKLRNNLMNLSIAFNNMVSKKSLENRISENQQTKNDQNFMDRTNIFNIRNNALEIFDECNRILTQI
jgi:hypothetical protein